MEVNPDRIGRALMLLHIMSENTKKKYDRGIVHLTKIVFLSERELKQNDFFGFNYDFFRWDHGAMTTDIFQDFNFLERNGGILSPKKNNESIPRVSEDGWHLIENCTELFTKNKSIIETINSIIRNYGKWNTYQIKEFCYRIPVDFQAKSTPIIDIPKGEKIVMPEGKSVEKQKFVINNEWLETILLTMDSEFIRDYKKTLLEIQTLGTTPLFRG